MFDGNQPAARSDIGGVAQAFPSVHGGACQIGDKGWNGTFPGRIFIMEFVQNRLQFVWRKKVLNQFLERGILIHERCPFSKMLVW